MMSLSGWAGVCTRLVPDGFRAAILSRALLCVFADHVSRGELEFLRGRRVSICVRDADVKFSVNLGARGFVVDFVDQPADLEISGAGREFFLLITRREDADTLFFHRRLTMQGDTELGLYVKNFLDGLDVESLPFFRLVDGALRRAMFVFGRATH